MLRRALVRIALMLVAVGLAGAMVLFGLVYRALEQDGREGAERQRAAFARHHAAFMSDRGDLVSHPALQGLGRSADAGAFLNARVRWSVPDVEDPTPAEAPLALPQAVTDWVNKHFSEDDVQVPAQFSKYDQSWMKELHRYDYWDIGSSPYSQTQRGYDLFTGPTPYFADLMTWAKLRALQALADGNAVAVHQDIAQLARLCISTETVLGGMIALALLSTDRTLHQRVRETLDAAAVAEWRVFSAEDVTRARRALFASPGYFGPFTPQEYWGAARIENVFDYIGAQEGLAGLHRYRALLEPVVPERYADAARVLAMARESCTFSGLHHAWGTHGIFVSDHDCDHESPTLEWQDACVKVRFAAVPGLHEVAARALQGGPIDPYSGFGGYERSP